MLVSATCVDTLDTDISGYQGDPPPGTMGSTMRALWTLLLITTQTLLDTAGHWWTLVDTGGHCWGPGDDNWRNLVNNSVIILSGGMDRGHGGDTGNTGKRGNHCNYPGPVQILRFYFCVHSVV